MKSIKPGRGPSMMNAAGAVFAAIFGVFWIIMTVKMGAPGFFPLFGVLFIGIACVQAVYHFKNATGKNRYSVFDIVDAQEEPDPLAAESEADEKGTVSGTSVSAAETGLKMSKFCPYCGASVLTDFDFCNQCGKKLPD